MNKLILIGMTMFFAIPVIAIFDYLIFSAVLKKNIEDAIIEYRNTGTIVIHPYAGLPACILESFFFIAGLFIGYAIFLA